MFCSELLFWIELVFDRVFWMVEGGMFWFVVRIGFGCI